jgi:plasmid stability protein
MATLHLTNLPEAVVERLRDRAQRSHRALEEEAADILVTAVAFAQTQASEVDVRLSEIRRFRQSLGPIFLTEEELQTAKREGME